MDAVEDRQSSFKRDEEFADRGEFRPSVLGGDESDLVLNRNRYGRDVKIEI